MKTICTLLSILLTTSIYSQTNFLPADSSIIWTGASTHYTGGPQGIYHYWTQFEVDSLNNDTIINSFEYTKINIKHDQNTSEYYTSFRSDTLNQKLYFIPEDSTNEYLFFDYSQNYNIGDTTFIPHYIRVDELAAAHFTLNHIDSILINMSYYKTYNFTATNIIDSLTNLFGNPNYASQEIKISERMITSSSFPFFGIGAFESFYSLSCYQENGDYKYDDVTFGTCPLLPDNYLFSSLKSKEQLTLLNIYPNPSSGSFSIEVNYVDESDLNIYDTNGKKVHQIRISSKLTSLDLSHLKSGIYILTLNSENTTITEKLIIK